MQDIILQLTQVVGTWSQMGALAGLVALVNLLVLLTKVSASPDAPSWLSKALGWVKPCWRPWIALGLGALGGFLAALQTGAPFPQAIASGVTAGLTAIGVHQTISNMRPSEKAKAEASATVQDALAGEEAAVKAKVETLKANLDMAMAEPDKKARLKKLADLANARV